MCTRELLKTQLTELKEKQVIEFIISIQDERSLSCIDLKSCRNTIPLKAHTTAKYIFTERGCECPFSTTAETSAVASTYVARQLSHFSPSKRCSIARRHWNQPSLAGAQWQSSTKTFDAQNELDSSMSLDRLFKFKSPERQRNSTNFQFPEMDCSSCTGCCANWCCCVK